jgi:hypothetical protein
MAGKKDIVEQALKLIFSGSKAVDEAGVPVRYYHGTTHDLPVVKPGTYFTEDPGEGSAYTFWTDLANAEKRKGKYSVISAPEMAGKRLEYFGTISDIDGPEVGKFYATDNGIMQYGGGGKWSVASDVGIDDQSLDMSDYTIGVKPRDNSEAAQNMVNEYEETIKRAYPGGVGGNVIPAYLNVKNPKEMPPLEGNRFGERLGADPKWVAGEIEKLKSQGYDSIVTTSDDPFYAMERKKPPKQYIIFEPTQVKSAVGNSGEYDFTNPRIDRNFGGRTGYAGKGRVVGSVVGDAVDAAMRLVAGADEPTKTGMVRGTFPGSKMPSVDALSRNVDKFVYHSGTAKDIPEMKYGVSPQIGPWVREVLEGAADDDTVNEIMENAVPVSWWSKEPSWAVVKVARELGKPIDQVTPEDLASYGHVALIPKKDPEAESLYWVGEEGLSSGPYSDVEDITGRKVKAYDADLYSGNYGPEGVERNEYITTKTVEPYLHLTGNELVDFLRKTGQYKKASGGRTGYGPGGVIDDIVKMAGKIVSGADEPAKTGIRAYHGSPNEISEFKSGMGKTAKDIYLTPFKEDASGYGKNVYEVNVSGKVGDFTPENRGLKQIAQLKEAYEGGLGDYFESFDDFLDALDSGDMYQRFGNQHAQNDVVSNLLHDLEGRRRYDAVRIPDAKVGGGMSESIVTDRPDILSIIRKYGIAGASAMLGYNLMEQLDPKQALAASMADQDYKSNRPQRSMGGNNSISGALNVARGMNGGK